MINNQVMPTLNTSRLLSGAMAGESAAAMLVNSVEKLLTSTSSLMAGLKGGSIVRVAT